MAIQKLPSITSLSAGDLFPVFPASVGYDSATTLATLLAWLQGQLTASGGMVTQYAAPSATGFSVTVTPVTTGGNVWLLLTPAAGYAAGTVVLPSPVDGQEVTVSCTQSVGTLTVSGNGYTVNGAPSSLSANGFFKLRYDGTLHGWYRVG